MKKSPMPKRASAMARTKALTRRTVKRTRAAQVTREERLTRRVVSERSGGVCERCGQARAAQKHHRRKAGRWWDPSNVVDVCGLGNAAGCHGEIEQNPTASKEKGWWLLPSQDPAREPVWLAGRGPVFLTSNGDISETQEAA